MALKRTTLRDVARMAGVTASTVSRLLNDKPLPVPVTETTRQRVMEAVRTLNYRPNRLAQGLAASQTHVIGMSFPMTSPLDRADHRDVTFFNLGMLISGVQRVAQARGYELHIFNRVEHHYDPESPPRPLNHDFIDGVIYVEPNPRYEYYREQIEQGFPIVMLGPNPTEEAVYSVAADDRAELRSLVRGVLSRGHRRVGYLLALMNEPPMDVLRRVEGYREAHAEAGVPVDPELLRFDRVPEVPTEVVVGQVLSRAPRPTALLVGRTEVGVDVLNQVLGCGIRVPEDLEIVVIGDDRIFDVTQPRLSALRFDYLQMGAEAARVLVDAVEGLEQDPRQIVVPWRFMQRDSSRPVAGPGSS